MSGIIMDVLKVADKVLDIRKKAEEVRALALSNRKIANDLEKEAEKEKNAGLDRISSDTVKRLSIKSEGDGEKVNALGGSIKKLADFVEKGGEVDFVLPEAQDEEGEEHGEESHQKRENLRMAFREIRELQQKVRQIEHKKAS
jgi:hypothetical protein